MRKAALLALVLPAALAGCLGGGPAGEPPVATGQIDGAVVDQLLRPFSGQRVYLSELGLRDDTSPLGGFTFRDVPVGTYTLITSHEGTRGDVAIVTVTEGRITKVILQLMPLPQVLPEMLIQPHSSKTDYAFPGATCDDCAWTLHLEPEKAPAEVVFEAFWEATLLGQDEMRFEVLDDRGDLLYQSPVPASGPVSISIDGDDIPAGTRALHVAAAFGDQFTPRANFNMEYVVTLYYGATKAELYRGA